MAKPRIKLNSRVIQEAIASICGDGLRDISINATITGKMGFVGREEVLVTHPVCLINKL